MFQTRPPSCSSTSLPPLKDRVILGRHIAALASGALPVDGGLPQSPPDAAPGALPPVLPDRPPQGQQGGSVVLLPGAAAAAAAAAVAAAAGAGAAAAAGPAGAGPLSTMGAHASSNLVSVEQVPQVRARVWSGQRK